ncbi:MAG: UDP-3-O-acyl-N-acetylglucosamine deacetylase [Deltaproteobacteria bacterium]|nr:UDP-3-O-acyl-N-acetylglucosamine deacetylase [Deltaproteobacteria bacterium]
MRLNLAKQFTLRESVYFEGVGLHSGGRAEVTLHPAPEATGIVFMKAMGRGMERFRATLDRVVDTQLATTVGNRQFRVATVEHLLSAIVGMGIDNVFVEISGEEIPVLDGSAKPFVEGIRSAGLLEQQSPRSWIKIKESVSVNDYGRRAVLLPSDEFEVSCSIYFDHRTIQDQFFHNSISARVYETEIAPSRTFGFLSEVNRLRSIGLARGGSLENAVVIGEFGVLNREGLRFEDEFVRHKVLDAIGDFSLLGYPILGQLVIDRSGHSLHHRLMMALWQSPSCWEITTEIPTSISPLYSEDSRFVSTHA